MIVIPASALQQQQQQPGAPFGGIPAEVIVAINFTEWWLKSQVVLDQVGLIDDPPRGLPPAACNAFLASCECIEQYVGGKRHAGRNSSAGGHPPVSEQPARQ